MRGIRNETPALRRRRPARFTIVSISTPRCNTSTSAIPAARCRSPSTNRSGSRINSFTQLDWIVTPKQIVTATLHLSSAAYQFRQSRLFQSAARAPSYAQHNIVGTVADHFGLFGGILDSSVSFQRFDAVVGAQGDADMIVSPAGNQRQFLRHAESLTRAARNGSKPIRPSRCGSPEPT